MPNPTISIVTTVYDAKDYIPRTVRSILAQSFTDFELLLVEDGSPNGCGELCDELAKTDPRIRVFHKENGGPASALNVGLDNARGDYIGFVDSDDLVDPDLYETLLNAIRENNVRIASCNADAVDEQEKPVPGAGVNINIAGRHMAMELLLDTWIDEVEDQLKENTVYQGMLEKISKYEEQVQTMGLSKEKRKTIDKYVTEVSERWILYAESLYQAGMQKILELLNL